MINKDLIKQKATQMMQKLSDALTAGNVEQAAEAFQEMQTGYLEAIEQEFEQYRDVSDMQVLQQRGLRALTSEEQAWYQKFMEAVKTGAKQAITNLTAAMPVTIIDRVIEDMQKEHPLLSEISIQNAAGAMRLVMNGVQMASKLGSWGAVASAISQEVAGQIKTIDVTAAKYTAYFLIPKDFVKFNFAFAPMWTDQYIRLILSESVAFGLERTIVKGDGNGQFIGMIMDTSTSNNGTYSAKTAVAVADWEDGYADVVSELAVDENGDYRNVQEVLLVVNPKDYIKKVRRAQNAITSAGVIDMISNTFPTKVVTSAMMDEGKAVVGIAKNYFAAINGSNSGIIEFDDSAQFIQDNRVYTTRMYGNGRPVDNTSFVYLNISGVKGPAQPVRVVDTVETETVTP